MVLTLALGIGATVSVFSIIHAVMITPLPYDHPSRLFSVFESKLSNDEAEKDGVAPGGVDATTVAAHPDSPSSAPRSSGNHPST